ncbi:ABC-type nitrate/sulfonate/bicarbonate transport system, substrate-binding protein [Mesonia phycicola]|uniref:ABC-type nitrate/sulfonate/bicarbonate transport system, substrate-binding protein n=1 Tax=Mesonia phycicola TaxID=579105 RepID=A0A1M6BIA5_9FLAO|nr:substrate-binding domain-containing protein [Mesonia phycicola]SHI48318.1 ABC-type nitrate/sulfonate/bicarbonate transport system, substrate-binding protein [Mesonia phycicola]
MTTIKVGGVPEHFNYPWHIAIEEKKFEEAGINIEWTDFYGGTGELSEALSNGEIDIALMLTEGVVKKIIEGSDFKILQNYIASPLIWGIHVAANSKFNHVNELENTTAAISRFGSGSHLLAYINAKNHGWDTSNLNFEVVNDLSGAVKALPNDDAQYFMWEHFTTKPLVDDGTFRRLGDCPSPWPCFVIASTQKFTQNFNKDITTVLEILNSITRDFKKLDNLAEILADRYHQKEEDIKLWLQKTEWDQEQIKEETIEETQNQLFDLDLINKKLPFLDFITI